MPKIDVLFYMETSGRAPVAEWLNALRKKDEQAFAKCAALIRRPAQEGHELRRPVADLLRDGIYELRARKGHVNYRLLYFFHGNVAVLHHALTKEARITPMHMGRALNRKRAFESDPEAHTYEGTAG